MNFIEHFHFLRPWWLLIIPICIAITFAFWKFYQLSQNNWKQAVDPDLLKHLLSQEQAQKHQRSLLAASLLWVLAGLALAGPTWEKLPQPAHQTEDALVIVLDLSISTLASDVKPSRIERAKLKVLDLLKQQKDGLKALVVYSGDAHKVVPLTEDTATIAALVPTLSPLLMPAPGSRVDLAFDTAYELFDNSQITKGQILLITDDIAAHHAQLIEDKQRKRIKTSILVVGTESGAPIPLPNQGFLKDQEGAIVIPKVEEHRLKKIAERWNAKISTLTIGDEDLKYLLFQPSLKAQIQGSEVNSDRYFDNWREMGPWLILILLPGCALFFRRGLLLAFPLFILASGWSPTSYALDWNSLWATPNQQGMKNIESGNAEAASKQFEDPHWKGFSQYQSGDYPGAIETLSTLSGPEAAYNLGNAYAKNGQYQEAIAAYENALKLEPNHADAEYNKNKIEELLKQSQQDSNQGQDKESDEKDNDNASSEQSNNENNSQDQQGSESEQNSSDSSENSSENKDNSQAQNENESSDKQNSQEASSSDQQEEAEQNKQELQQEMAQQNEENASQQTSKEQEAQDSEDQEPSNTAYNLSDKPQTEQEQSLEQWLRRVPDDPGGLLRRKFEYQYQQNQRNPKKKTSPQEEPLW